ncbi:MAG: hypothetical protein H6728_05705 [Myxococcales bacterium]|nr:hypothetical protein [Myxococcales bacterium]MCB9642552.1 hypothetical protein [Myxococcales bacterium]
MFVRRLLISAALTFSMFFGGASLFAQQAHASVRDITMSVSLLYRNGRSKRFIWKLRYYPATGLCIGRVRDRDGFANFDGSYDPVSRVFRLVKHYPNRTRGRKRYYYTGRRLGKRKVMGTARFDSHFGRKYADWTATVLFSKSVYRPRYRKIHFRGKLNYINSREANKRFSWTLKYDADSGVCIGTVTDRDGFATFNGTYDRVTRRFYLVKHFKYRRRGRNKYYYKGRIIGGRFFGTAHFDSFYGRRYATWRAKKLF